MSNNLLSINKLYKPYKYTIKGKLVVKPKDKTTTDYEYVKDANGKIVESKVYRRLIVPKESEE